MESKTAVPTTNDSPYLTLEKPNSVSVPPPNLGIKFPKFPWKILGLVLCGLCLGYILGSEWPWLQVKPTGALAPQNLAATPNSAGFLRPGPWGNLKAQSIYVEPPDEYLPTQSIENLDRRWRFSGFTPNQLLALFKSADLTAGQRTELLDTSTWQQTQGAIYVNPSKELILSLSPKARKQIYVSMLAEPDSTYSLLNRSYSAASFNNYFDHSGLPTETIDLINKLSFPYGNLIFFCDVQTVLDTLPTFDQKNRFLKFLLRQPTLLLGLHIAPDSDLNELENYWLKAGHGRDLRPILESLAALPHGGGISLVKLLPPIPSTDIYTYPFPSLKPEDQHKDCRWTSLNFFRDVPDDRLTDPKVVMQTLLTDYYPVLSDARYGDLVMLAKPNGDIIHVAVYIAADIVYTKNSDNFLDPFILMTIPDMLNHFASKIPEDQKLHVLIYRNKSY